jgi:hypothetical protein
MAAQVFCCERRKGLNNEERTGYLLSGFTALTPVKVLVWSLHFYHRAGTLFFSPLKTDKRSES